MNAPLFPGEIETYDDYGLHRFTCDDCKCIVVEPRESRPGRKRIWEAEFFETFPSKDHAVQDWNIKTKDGTPMEGRFHVYSVIWDENKVEWFIDNRKTFEAVRQPGEPWCADNPQYIILNHALGSYSGEIPPELNEASFYIDYVRVYQ